MPDDDDETTPPRVYEKGENRYKHVGKSEYPEIYIKNDNPKYKIGKCPKGISDETKNRLLAEALPIPNSDGEVDFPERLHVVHEGCIYRVETTNWGVSYHAYPYEGKLGRSVVKGLRDMADRRGCLTEFDKWVKIHIEIHGK